MYKKFSNQEKLDMIMECRSSGLSDYQWCKQNGISSSTFYNWTIQLKKAGNELPASAGKDHYYNPVTQDVVKLELVDDISLPVDANSFPIDTSAVEITVGKAVIKISNNVSPALLSSLMSCIGGCL